MWWNSITHFSSLTSHATNTQTIKKILLEYFILCYLLKLLWLPLQWWMSHFQSQWDGGGEQNLCVRAWVCSVQWRLNHTVQMFLVYPCNKLIISIGMPAGLLQIWSYCCLVVLRTQSPIIPWYWNGQPFSNFQLIMICVHNITCFRLNFWTKSLIDPFWSHTPYGSGFSWQSRIDNMVSSSRLLDTNEWMDSHF